RAVWLQGHSAATRAHSALECHFLSCQPVEWKRFRMLRRRKSARGSDQGDTEHNRGPSWVLRGTPLLPRARGGRQRRQEHFLWRPTLVRALSLKDLRRFASARACTSVRPVSAACTISYKRSSTTRSTRPSRAMPTTSR